MAKTQVDTSIDEHVLELDAESRDYVTRDQKQGPRYRKAAYHIEEQTSKQDWDWVQQGYALPYKELILPGINGQYRLWKAQLRRRAEMADRVIQLGNLLGTQREAIDPMFKNKTVYSGNTGVVFAIIKFFSQTHEGWEQLIGTNEIAAIFSPDVYLCSEKATEMLAEHWFTDDGCLKVAAVVDGKLATHRGLTYIQWLEIGAPEDAQTAADRLNERWKGAMEFSDCYLNSGVPNHGADPIWADTYYETYSSWVVAPQPCPFPQIHSAAGLHTEAGRMFLNDKSSFVQFIDKKDITIARWGSSVRIKGQDFISAHTKETEADTTLKKLANSGLLEYQSPVSEG